MDGDKTHREKGILLALRPGNRVRELRKAARMSQIELAGLAGVSQPAISQVENDTRSLTISWMRTFASIFGCTTADILSEDDNPYRLTSEETRLIEHYRAAGPIQRELISRIAEPLPCRYECRSEQLR